MVDILPVFVNVSMLHFLMEFKTLRIDRDFNKLSISGKDVGRNNKIKFMMFKYRNMT